MTTWQPLRLAPDGRALLLLDQRLLPHEETWLTLDDVEAVARSIEDMAVRGAPAIGCAAALGLAAASHGFSPDPEQWRQAFARACERLAATRPTAVNLFVALERMRKTVATLPTDRSTAIWVQRLREEAERYVAEDLAACHRIGDLGAALLPDGGILTHCNAGALATAGYGTALGVIRSAWRQGRRVHVFADETRPRLQGARLTAWELARDDIPVQVICDGMAASLMAQGQIQAAVVGADRIVRNGDVVNKIGTYGVAVLCKYHGIPFYVAAPWTTVDLSLAHGAQVPIEHRAESEVRSIGDTVIAPPHVPVCNPAFDVTPAALVTAIVTDRGVFAPERLASA